MTRDRQLLRETFEAAADRYDQARPDYPDKLFEALMRLTGVQRGAHVLEIGCGTGKATLPLANRGLQVTCIELGAALAAAARRRLGAFPEVEVIHADFESWEPSGRSFDLVVAATAWHWINPDTRYQKARDLLRPGGHLAFWSATHVFPEHGDPFFQEVQGIYDEIGEGLPAGAAFPRPGQVPDDRAEIEGSGLFDEIAVSQFDWELVYDAGGYIALLETFSDHLAMQPAKRERLYGEVRRRLADRPNGRLRRHWGSVLHTARRPPFVT
jgi:SAM-dependent methyltransferase